MKMENDSHTLQQLEEQRRQAALLLQCIPGGVAIYRVKKSGIVTTDYVSDGLAHLCGFDTGEEFLAVLRDDAASNICPEDRPRVMSAVSDALEKGHSLHATYRVYAKDRSLTWIRLDAETTSAVPLEEDDVAVLYAVHTRLSPSAQLYQHIVEQNRSTGICVITRDNHTILYANEWVNRLCGQNSCVGLPCFPTLVGSEEMPEQSRFFEDESVFDTPHDMYVPQRKRYFRVLAEKTDWDGIPAYLLYLNDITDERVSEQKYQAIVENTPAGLVTLFMQPDGSLRPTFINQAFLEMTGMTEEEAYDLYAEDATRGVHPDDLPIAVQCLEAMARTGKTEGVYRLRHGKSGYIWVRVSGLLLHRSNQDCCYMIYQDITQQKQREQSYQDDMDCLLSTQSVTLLGKCRANLTRDLVDNYNSEGDLVTNPEEQVYSNTVENVAALCADPDKAEEFRQHMTPDALAQRFAAGKPEYSIEYRRRMANGDERWVRTYVKTSPNPTTGDLFCFMYTYDIDEEKTSQSIIDRITALDYETVALVNVATGELRFFRTTDLDLQLQKTDTPIYDEQIQCYINACVIPDEQAVALQAASLSTVIAKLSRHPSYEFAITVAGKEKPGHKKWAYSYLDDNHATILCFRSDITSLFEEQERQKATLQEALALARQASVAKTEFLSRMSHEIRTPMNAIIGMSTLAAQNVNDPEQVSDCISKVGISARFLLSLINDILDMSRIESGKVTLREEPFRMDNFLNGINTMIYELAEEKGVDYDCIPLGDIRNTYRGDSMKLQQVLLNLLTNAVKFTDKGGKVQFIIELQHVTHKKSWMKFTVNDTGIGISEDFLSHLFEPFEQEHTGQLARFGGTGLGLAISKNFVEIMGGRISVNSIEGVGSEFVVTLPLDEVETPEDEPGLKCAIPWEKLRLLVVDDEVLICEQTVKILTDMGAKAEWVDSGARAIDKVKERHSRSSDYDIILIDWKMPVMDGIETARIIRSIVGPDVTIIIMTAYDWIAIESEAKKAGVNLLISKPLLSSSVSMAVEKVYEGRAHDAQPAQKRAYDFTGKRCLLVEDHLMNVEVAKRLLMARHMEVDVAENGLKAIEMIASRENGYYHAILMDIRMPIMDGLTATRAIRQMSMPYAKVVPIIAMSANAFDEDVHASLDAGMNAHLAKPIDPEKLYETLTDWIAKIGEDC